MFLLDECRVHTERQRRIEEYGIQFRKNPNVVYVTMTSPTEGPGLDVYWFGRVPNIPDGVDFNIHFIESTVAQFPAPAVLRGGRHP
jgi:hypothetical protein